MSRARGGKFRLRSLIGFMRYFAVACGSLMKRLIEARPVCLYGNVHLYLLVDAT